MKNLVTLLALVLGLAAHAAPLSDADKAEFVPKNILTNPGAENLTQGWTATGGTFTTTSTLAHVRAGKRAFSWDSSAAAQILSSPTALINGLAGTNGSAQCRIKTASGTATHKLQVYDGTNVVAEQAIVSASVYTPTALSFIFPASGSVRLRLVSVASNEPLIYVDECQLGENQLIALGQAVEIGAAVFTAGGGCAGYSATSATQAPLVENAAGCTIAYRGQASALTSTTEFGFKVVSLKKGKYKLNVGGSLARDGASTPVAAFRVEINGTEVATVGDVYCGSGISCRTSGGSTTFELTSDVTNAEIKVTGSDGGAGTVTATVYVDTGPATLSLHRFPVESEQAVRMDTVAWRVEALQKASPTGPVTLGLTVAAHDRITVPLAQNLTLTTQPGSIAAKQLCDGVAATGSTCSVDAVVGFEFSPPRAGTAKVCASFSHDLQTTGGNSQTFFRIDKLNSLATTITEVGAQGYYSGIAVTAGQATRYNAVTFCENKTFTSTNPVSIGLTREVVVAAAGNNILDNGIYWTVEPIDQQVPAPILIGGVVTPSTGVEKLVRAQLDRTAACSSSPCTIASQSGGVSSVTRASAGIYGVNFVAGTFSGTPSCVAMGADTGPGVRLCYGIGTPTSTVFGIACVDGAIANTDAAFDLICQGSK